MQFSVSFGLCINTTVHIFCQKLDYFVVIMFRLVFFVTGIVFASAFVLLLVIALITYISYFHLSCHFCALQTVYTI